jgi:hypothetical protein
VLQAKPPAPVVEAVTHLGSAEWMRALATPDVHEVIRLVGLLSPIDTDIYCQFAAPEQSNPAASQGDFPNRLQVFLSHSCVKCPVYQNRFRD